MYNEQEIMNKLGIFQLNAKVLLRDKNEDYSKHSDTFEYINNIAKSLEIQPIKVLFILFMKQVSALQTFAVHGDLADETINSRLYDIANYAFLIWYKLQLEKEANEDSSS